MFERTIGGKAKGKKKKRRVEGTWGERTRVCFARRGVRSNLGDRVTEQRVGSIKGGTGSKGRVTNIFPPLTKYVNKMQLEPKKAS